MHSRQGFTLLEIMVVCGIIAALAGVVIVAINPARQFGQTRNTQRAADLEKIQGALNQLAIETNGALPSTVSTTLQMIGTATSSCNTTCGGASSTAAVCTNLDSTLVPTYIPSVPFDPSTGNTSRTYYAIQKITLNASSAYGLLLRACSPELGKAIQIRQ